MSEPESTILSTLSPAIFGLVGVLVGSGIHFVGLLFDRKWKREQKLAERYEDFCQSVGMSLVWFREAGDAKNLTELSSLAICLDSQKVVTLSRLYFRELEAVSIQFSNNLVSYHHLLVDSVNCDSKETAGTEAILKNKESYMELADTILKLKNDLDDLIKKHSHEYAKV